MKKRVLALLLVLAVAMGLLACGGSGASGASGSQAAPAESSASEESTPAAETDPYAVPTNVEEPAEPIELVWVGSASPNKFEELVITKWEKMHPNVKIKFIDSGGQGGDVDTIITTKIAAGEQVDLHYTGTEAIMAGAVSGTYLPLDEYMAVDGEEYTDMFGELASLVTTYEGKHYGFPKYYNTFLVYYNKTLMDEKGITIPDAWSVDEFLAVAQQLNDPENDFWGCVYPSTWEDLTFTPALLSGWDYVRVEGDKIVPNFDSEILKKSMTWVRDLADVYGVSPSMSTIQAESINRRAYLATHKTAMICDGPFAMIWWQNFMFNDPGDGPLDFELGATSFPYLDESGSHCTYATVVGAYGIPKTSKNPQWAYEFIKFLETDNEIAPKNMSYLSTFEHWEDRGTTQGDISVKAMNEYIDMDGKLHTDIYGEDTIKAVTKIRQTPHQVYWKTDLAHVTNADALMYLLYCDQYALFFNHEMEFEEWAKFVNDLGTEQLSLAGLDTIKD